MRHGGRHLAAVLTCVAFLGSACVDEGPGADFDDDGLRDEIEDPNESFSLDPGETDFNHPDTDRDGLCDGDPPRPLTVCTGCEDCNNDGFWQPCQGETDPLNDDTDGDGIGDSADASPLDGFDCSGGQDPQLRPGDSLPPGKPLPGSGGATPTPAP